jgi:hypothetical protein
VCQGLLSWRSSCFRRVSRGGCFPTLSKVKEFCKRSCKNALWNALNLVRDSIPLDSLKRAMGGDVDNTRDDPIGPEKQRALMVVQALQELTREYRDELETSFLGLKWEEAVGGADEGAPELTDDEHEAFKRAFAARAGASHAGVVEFSRVEWNSFGVDGLTERHFVRVGGKCFKPAVASGPSSKELSASEMTFLQTFFKEDHGRLQKRRQALQAGGASAADLARLQRRWMANRFQCASRCIRGMMKGWEALRLHLSSELPGLSDAQIRRLTSSKFRCLACLQAYARYKPCVYRDVNDLFRPVEEGGIPGARDGGLAIGYMTEEGGKLCSFVIDGAKFGEPDVPGGWFAGKWVAGKEGVQLAPTFRVELPTDKIGKLIYNGKADNQQANLIFTRGEIVQESLNSPLSSPDPP